MYPPFDDADPTDERMVSALNFALSGRGDAVDDAALALGLALAGRTSGARHSSLSPSESSVASTTSMMSTASFASSLAPSDAPADEHVVMPDDTLAGFTDLQVLPFNTARSTIAKPVTNTVEVRGQKELES